MLRKKHNWQAAGLLFLPSTKKRKIVKSEYDEKEYDKCIGIKKHGLFFKV